MKSRRWAKGFFHPKKFPTAAVWKSTFLRGKTSLGVLLCLTVLPRAFAEIPNFPEANLVLGQPSFTTATSGLTARRLSGPSGISVDPNTGKVFLADAGNNRVLRYRSFSELASGAAAEAVFGQPGLSTSAPIAVDAQQFNSPSGLHVDGAGRLWVADTLNNRVLMFEQASSRGDFPFADKVVGQSGFGGNSPATGANRLNNPRGVAIDDANDILWVADTGNNRVVGFAEITFGPVAGSVASKVVGHEFFTLSGGSVSVVGLNSPRDVTIAPNGSLWVADFGANRVLRYDNSAAITSSPLANAALGQTFFGTNQASLSSNGLNGPASVAFDANGTLWVLDSLAHRVVGFENAVGLPNGSAANRVIGQPDFGSNSTALTAQQFQGLIDGGIAVDRTGSLWASDSLGNRVLRFSPVIPPDPPNLSAPPNPAAPTLVIRGPGTIRTTRNRVVIRGTAAAPSGVALVQFRVGSAAFRAAIGTNSWRAPVRINRNSPRTVVRIRAISGAGTRSASKSVRIINARHLLGRS